MECARNTRMGLQTCDAQARWGGGFRCHPCGWCCYRNSTSWRTACPFCDLATRTSSALHETLQCDSRFRIRSFDSSTLFRQLTFPQ
ncbi:hypothetical protein JG687_00015818 [Phytophthora cactorum]|uniref:Uncharacterized protein n=1 Tax=Phytophthora cactorum TaxID=29920 RepID=A0A8T1TUX2_9STRA|nr:hypothetical protein JG687_00015818 [Phytophthora cactorum]